MSKRFRVLCDATFLADDIDDAFAKLAEHFAAKAADPMDDPQIFIATTRFDLAPVDDEIWTDAEHDPPH